jgi:hypothetical protein
MDEIVSRLDIRILSLMLVVGMLVAWEISRRMGLRDKGHTRSSKFDDGAMALLGLLIAFTFGMSIERHDRRRLMVVADSNAIGDFYTCAALLNEPTRGKLQAVIQQYAQLRLALARGSVSIESALDKSDQMHRQMTELVAQALRVGTPIAVSLTNTLNAVSSNQASRLWAFRDRLPGAIIGLLFAGAIIAALLIGREQGSADVQDVLGSICFILLVSTAVYVTLDLNQPERGLIQISQEPIERLVRSMPK